MLGSDTEEKDRLDNFRSDLTAFINAYDFLSQVLNYEDTSIEKLAIYARALARVIRTENLHQPIDLTGVELIGFSMRKKETTHIGLGAVGELDPMTATGTARGHSHASIDIDAPADEWSCV